MPDTESPSVVTLETQISERYGLLLSQTQLAQLLGRTTGGLHYSLSYPCDHQTRAPSRTPVCPGRPGACSVTCCPGQTTGGC